MVSRASFVQSLLSEQADLDAFVRALTPEQRSQPQVCGIWSTKDVIVHLAVWARYITSMLRAWLRQRPASNHELWGFHVPVNLSDDALNQWFVDQAKDTSFDEAYGILVEVHAQLIGTVELLTDEELNTPGLAIPGLGYTNSGTIKDAVTHMSFRHVWSHLREDQHAPANVQ